MAHRRKHSGMTWEARREEVIGRCPGCHYCGDESATLNVHHQYYKTGKERWDYPGRSLIALCNRCHARADHFRRRITRACGVLSGEQAIRALGYTEALAKEDDGPIGSIELMGCEYADGVGAVFGLTGSQVIGFAVNRIVQIADLFRASAYRHHRQALGLL